MLHKSDLPAGLTFTHAKDCRDRFKSVSGMLHVSRISRKLTLSVSLKSMRMHIWWVFTFSSCLLLPKVALRSETSQTVSHCQKCRHGCRQDIFSSLKAASLIYLLNGFRASSASINLLSMLHKLNLDSSIVRKLMFGSSTRFGRLLSYLHGLCLSANLIADPRRLCHRSPGSSCRGPPILAATHT